jgi:hypothetical protein
VEKTSQEWSDAKGNGAKATAPAKPDLDDEELQVSGACLFACLSRRTRI